MTPLFVLKQLDVWTSHFPSHMKNTDDKQMLQHLTDCKYNISSSVGNSTLTKAELMASTKLSSSSSRSSSASRWLVDHTRELSVSDSCGTNNWGFIKWFKQNTSTWNTADMLPVTLRWVLLEGTSAMRHCSLWAVQHENEMKSSIVLKLQVVICGAVELDGVKLEVCFIFWVHVLTWYLW